MVSKTDEVMKEKGIIEDGTHIDSVAKQINDC